MRTAVPPDSFLDFSDSSARIILPQEERGHVIDPHYGEPPWGRADTSRVSQEKGSHYHWPPEEAIILGDDSDNNNNVIGDDSRVTGREEDDRIIVSHDKVIVNPGGDSHPAGKEHL
jgi:hypothetical protein